MVNLHILSTPPIHGHLQQDNNYQYPLSTQDSMGGAKFSG